MYSKRMLPSLLRHAPADLCQLASSALSAARLQHAGCELPDRCPCANRSASICFATTVNANVIPVFPPCDQSRGEGRTFDAVAHFRTGAGGEMTGVHRVQVDVKKRLGT